MDTLSLKTLPNATSQQVFDHVAQHLLAQGERSLVLEPGAPAEDLTPAYRSPTGLKDAAGSLMSDDEYSFEMEGNTWEGIVASGAAPKEHAGLISGLNNVHDNHHPSAWPEQLLAVAQAFNLSPAVLEKNSSFLKN